MIVCNLSDLIQSWTTVHYSQCVWQASLKSKLVHHACKLFDAIAHEHCTFTLPPTLQLHLCKCCNRHQNLYIHLWSQTLSSNGSHTNVATQQTGLVWYCCSTTVDSRGHWQLSTSQIMLQYSLLGSSASLSNQGAPCYTSVALKATDNCLFVLVHVCDDDTNTWPASCMLCRPLLPYTAKQ